MEYTNEVKRILSSKNSEYIPIEEHNEEVEGWKEDYKTQEEFNKKLQGIIAINFEMVSYILQKNLTKEEILELLLEVKKDLGGR